MYEHKHTQRVCLLTAAEHVWTQTHQSMLHALPLSLFKFCLFFPKCFQRIFLFCFPLSSHTHTHTKSNDLVYGESRTGYTPPHTHTHTHRNLSWITHTTHTHRQGAEMPLAFAMPWALFEATSVWGLKLLVYTHTQIDRHTHTHTSIRNACSPLCRRTT